MRKKIQALTLLELLIAIILVFAILYAINNIEVFSRYQVTAADQRAKVQNEISFALEHMHKHIVRAIGNASDWPVLRDADGNGIRIRIDSNYNGQVDSGDTWIAYRHENLGAQDSEIRYYSNIVSSPGTYERIANKIVREGGSEKGLRFIGNFNPTTNFLEDSIIEIVLTGRWRPDQPSTEDNADTSMRTRIYMPSVSIR